LPKAMCCLPSNRTDFVVDNNSSLCDTLSYMMSAIFWDVTPNSLAEDYRHNIREDSKYFQKTLIHHRTVP
jgi:hypothetical protein